MKITLKPHDNIKLEPGKYYDYDNTWTVIPSMRDECDECGECDGDGGEYEILKENGELLCYYKPHALSSELCTLAVQCYLDAGKMISTNRGTAAGMDEHRILEKKFEKGKVSNSNIIGYIYIQNHKRPCRLTMYSKNHFEKYSAGLPFIKEIDKVFSETVPEKYNLQKIATNSVKKYQILDTSFSTVTVNYNFRTALHKDSGDFRKGFGNLVVCKTDTSKGGLLLFPKYKLAIDLNNGDFLAMDVHEYHCNSPILTDKTDKTDKTDTTVKTGGECKDSVYRLSFVCYLREKMAECNKINATLERLQINTNQKWDTQIIFDKIFASVGETNNNKNKTPEKVKIDSEKRWWTMSAGRFVLTYKNKRYELFDNIANKTIHNLMPSWEYVNGLGLNIDAGSESGGSGGGSGSEGVVGGSEGVVGGSGDEGVLV